MVNVELRGSVCGTKNIIQSMHIKDKYQPS